MKKFAILLCFVLPAACSRHSDSAKVVHRYPLSGKIVSLDPQHGTASVAASAIPNYMEAMTMDYPIKSKLDFASLHVGEEISATLTVTDDDRYTLSDIKPRGHNP